MDSVKSARKGTWHIRLGARPNIANSRQDSWGQRCWPTHRSLVHNRGTVRMPTEWTAIRGSQFLYVYQGVRRSTDMDFVQSRRSHSSSKARHGPAPAQNSNFFAYASELPGDAQRSRVPRGGVRGVDHTQAFHAQAASAVQGRGGALQGWCAVQIFEEEKNSRTRCATRA